MKITKSELRKMIDESVQNVLNENENNSAKSELERLGEYNRTFAVSMMSLMEALLEKLCRTLANISDMEYKKGDRYAGREIDSAMYDMSKLRDKFNSWKKNFDEVLKRFPQALITHPIENNSSVQQTQTSNSQ